MSILRTFFFRSNSTNMSDENSSNNTNESSGDEDPIPNNIRFWILLSLEIPAVICTVFLLYHLLLKRQLRQALHNHIVIIILINILMCQLFDMSFYIVFLHLGYVWWAKPGFCLFWWYMDTGPVSFCTIFLAYGSFERHILIFHSHLVSSRRKRLIFHYIPLFCVVMYCFIFYSYAILFPPCQNRFYYDEAWCSYPCYFDDPVLGPYDTIGNGFIVGILNIIADVGLIVRHIRHRRRIRQSVQFRKYRKMLIQLLSISVLVLFFTLPILFGFGIEQCGVQSEIIDQMLGYAFFFNYFIILLLPYPCFIPFPELRRIIYGRIQNVLGLQHTITVTRGDVLHRN